MTQRLLFYGLVCCFAACKQDPKSSPSQAVLPEKRIGVSEENLQGIWQFSNASEPAFQIKGNEFGINENGAFIPMKYSLSGDTIILHYPNNQNFQYKVEIFEGDSLHFLDEMNTNTYFKVKK